MCIMYVGMGAGCGAARVGGQRRGDLLAVGGPGGGDGRRARHGRVAAV